MYLVDMALEQSCEGAGPSLNLETVFQVFADNGAMAQGRWC